MAWNSFSCRDLLRLLGPPWSSKVSASSTGPGSVREKVPANTASYLRNSGFCNDFRRLFRGFSDRLFGPRHCCISAVSIGRWTKTASEEVTVPRSPRPSPRGKPARPIAWLLYEDGSKCGIRGPRARSPMVLVHQPSIASPPLDFRADPLAFHLAEIVPWQPWKTTIGAGRQDRCRCFRNRTWSARTCCTRPSGAGDEVLDSMRRWASCQGHRDLDPVRI